MFKNLNQVFKFLIVWLLAGCSQQAFLLAPATEVYPAKVIWNNRVDILWIIDNTPSMAQHQNMLAQKAGDFLTGLLQRNLDFRIASTTTDMRSGGLRGAFIGSPSVVTPSTANIYDVFRSKIVVGEEAYDLEQGLAAMKRAFELRTTTNTGFFRDDALLVVVVVTNEDDGSPETTTAYINFLDSIKPRTTAGDRNWILHLIGVTGQAGEDCRTYGNYREPGYRYMELVNASGGAQTTICTADFAAALAGVEKRIYDTASRFYLDRIPEAGSIRVVINGVVIPEDPVNGWTYNSIDNSVQLHGTAVPRTDVNVQIFYQPTSAK